MKSHVRGSESRLEQKVKKSLLDPDFIKSGRVSHKAVVISKRVFH